MSATGAIYNPESANWSGQNASACWKPARWYAIRTEPSRELKAQTFIELLNVETFLPRLPSRYQDRDSRHRNLFQALFPGYLFALTPDEILPKLKLTHGVIGPVIFGGKPAQIRESIIDSIREGTDQQGYFTANELKIGDKAIILSGAYEGKEGIVSKILRENALQLIVNESLKWSVQVDKWDVVRA